MRRRQHERAARFQRWGTILIGLLMVSTMVVSLFSYGAGNTANQKLKYNGVKFTPTNEGFQIKVDGTLHTVHAVPLAFDGSTVTFQNLMLNTVTVTFDPAVTAFIDAAPFVAFTFDGDTPQPDIQFVELARFSLSQAYPNSFQGVLRPSTAYPALQAVDCTSAQPEYPVVALTIDNTTAMAATVTRDGDCVRIAGDAQGVLAAKDAIVLAHYGVITNADA